MTVTVMFLQVTVEKCFPFWGPVPKRVKVVHHLKLVVFLKLELGGDKVAVALHVLFRWLLYFL